MNNRTYSQTAKRLRNLNVLVTGGAGVIGRSLVKRLTCKITVLDNLSSSTADSIADLRESGRVKFVKGDVRDLHLMEEVSRDVDLIIHLAANGDVRYSPERGTDMDTTVNTIGTYNVLEAMRINDVKRIIFSSSSSVYGRAKQIPTSESYGPLIPESLYAASKLGAEALITSFAKMFGFNAYIFRFANIVSPNFRIIGRNVIPDFILKLKKNPDYLEILGNGLQNKSYLYVDDCVSGLFYVSGKSNKDVDVFNLGNKDSLSVNEIASIVTEEMGLKDVEFRYTGGAVGWSGDIPITILDIKKVTDLGWTPELDSKAAVRKSARGIIKSTSLV